MKKLLSFALTLWSLVSLAQTTTKIAELNPVPGKYGSKYYVYYERDWKKYPGTVTGLTSLTNAIASGQLQLRVTTTGCIIPAGTKPPASPPSCSNPSGLPILAANTGLLSRYTYTTANGGTLQIRASGASSAQLKIETQSGQTLTLSNAQNPTIPYNTFVGYGPSGESAYPMDWTFRGVPAVPIRISMQTGGSPDVALFTPSVGTNVPLSGSSGTVNPPTSTTVTYRPIAKVLIEANSIGFYPINPGFGWYGNWGAAASAANKDFYHILSDSIHTIYPQADVRLWGQNNEQGISIAEGGYFEQEYDRLGDGLHRYDTLSLYAPDVLITRLGENVTEVRGTFQASWTNQINRVTIHSTNPLKIITTSGWGNSAVDNALISLANSNSWPWVDLRNIPGSRDGVVSHPNDAWHLTAANKIWATMKASLSTTTSTTTTPGSGTGVVDGDFIAGAFDFADLAPASIPSDYRASLETQQIKVTLDLKEGHEPDKGLAGGIRFFTDKSTGNNTLNVPVFQAGSGNDYGHPLGTVNDGRSINECLYRLPSPWTYNGVTLGIGDNLNETGDVTETPSRLISYGNNGTTLFTAIEPNQWDGAGLRTGEVFKKWIKVNGNEMRVWYESKFNRTASSGANERQESRVQEAPCNYLNGNYSTVYFYDGDTPYQNSSPRSLRLEDNSGMTPGATFLTENWVAGCDPATGRCQGMILETPATQIGQFQSKGSYNAEGSLLSSTYIAYYPFQMLDYNIRWRHSVIFVVGTLAEIRAKAYQYTSWKRTLEVRFNKSGRQNWGGRWFNDGGYKESRSSWGPITWTSNEGEIVTPAVALDGNIKKMYMRYRYNSTTRQNVNMVARWLRARQAAGYTNGTALWNERFPEGAAVGDDYAKTFSLVADGQWHVKEIDFSDKAQWRQIITQVRFTNDGASAIGESLEVEWISGNVNGPTN